MKAKAHTFNILRIVVVFFSLSRSQFIDRYLQACHFHAHRARFFLLFKLNFFRMHSTHAHHLRNRSQVLFWQSRRKKNVYKIALEIPPIGLNHHIFFWRIKLLVLAHNYTLGIIVIVIWHWTWIFSSPYNILTHTHTSYKYNESMMMRRKSFFVLCFQLFSSREGTVKRLKWKTVWRWENLVQNKIYKVQSDWKLRCSENFLLFLLKIFCRQFFFFLN